MTKLKFAFIIPLLSSNSGGLRAVHRLKDLLVKTGREVFYNRPCPSDCVAVYPDCVRGNPLGLQKRIRYMCYFASSPWFGGWTIPGHELAIIYHEFLRDDVQVHYARDLGPSITMPTVEPGLFNRFGVKDIHHVIYTGKQDMNWFDSGYMGARKNWLTTRTHPKTRGGYAALVNHAKVFTSMDRWTIANEEALLAGCEVWRPNEKLEAYERYYGDGMRWETDDKLDLIVAENFALQAELFFQ